MLALIPWAALQKVQEVEVEIGGLQSRLSELESERAVRAKAAADAAAALEESRGKLAKFAQVRVHCISREEAGVGECACVIVCVVVMEGRGGAWLLKNASEPASWASFDRERCG